MQIFTVLNSFRPSIYASKSSRKLCYGKISFAVLVPGQLLQPLLLALCNAKRILPRCWTLDQGNHVQNFGSIHFLICNRPPREIQSKFGNIFLCQHLLNKKQSVVLLVIILRAEPWSSGHGRRHVPNVVSSNPSTIYWMDIFSHLFVVKLYCLFEKTKKRKRGRSWPIF